MRGGRCWEKVEEDFNFPIGPIIGPLVIAGIALIEEKIHELVSIGVKDSKLLSPASRERLAVQIERIVDRHVSVEITPRQIDEVVMKAKRLQKLNLLEAKVMAEVISKLDPDIAYVDASDVKAERFGQWIVENLPSKIKVVSEHHADRTYPVVSAASIMAKTRRDNIVKKLREEYGDFGSGYVADPKSMAFIKDWLKRFGSPPPIVRKSWKPFRELEKSLAQTNL